MKVICCCLMRSKMLLFQQQLEGVGKMLAVLF